MSGDESVERQQMAQIIDLMRDCVNLQVQQLGDALNAQREQFALYTVRTDNEVGQLRSEVLSLRQQLSAVELQLAKHVATSHTPPLPPTFIPISRPTNITNHGSATFGAAASDCQQSKTFVFRADSMSTNNSTETKQPPKFSFGIRPDESR